MHHKGTILDLPLVTLRIFQNKLSTKDTFMPLVGWLKLLVHNMQIVTMNVKHFIDLKCQEGVDIQDYMS